MFVQHLCPLPYIPLEENEQNVQIIGISKSKSHSSVKKCSIVPKLELDLHITMINRHRMEYTIPLYF